jgi:hypothetical protein
MAGVIRTALLIRATGFEAADVRFGSAKKSQQPAALSSALSSHSLRLNLFFNDGIGQSLAVALRIGFSVQSRRGAAREASILKTTPDLVRHELFASSQILLAGFVIVEAQLQLGALTLIRSDALLDELSSLGQQPIIEVRVLVDECLLHRFGDLFCTLGSGVLFVRQLQALANELFLRRREFGRRSTAAWSSRQGESE